MKLGYVILYVPDVAAAVAFYERAFGLSCRFSHESGDYAEMETGGTALAFAAEALVSQHGHDFRPNRPTEIPAGAEVAFVADDVGAAFAMALAAARSLGRRPKPSPGAKPSPMFATSTVFSSRFAAQLADGRLRRSRGG
jgi:catechol 2,3-dioxygenase-like lactoylglutathione lyase family enzyme